MSETNGEKKPTNTFTDQVGRAWTVRITNLTVREIKDRMQIDIRELLNDDCKPLLELISDSLRLSQVLFIACVKQAESASVTEDEFLEGIYGDVGESAAEAFSSAFVDFFPNPQLREALREILGMIKETQKLIVNGATEQIANSIASVDTKSIANSFVQQASSA